MLPQQLVDEIEELKREAYSIELVDANGYANAIFHDYPVPPGFSKASIELLLKLPMSYPNGRPDMFWTDEDLSLEDGSVPNRADAIEEILAKRWRRFSWHPANWNPGSDNLRTYLEFVNNRLAKAV